MRVAALACALAATMPVAAPALESRALTIDGVDYRFVRVDLAHEVLDLYWLDDNGAAYGSIDALRRSGEAGGRALRFAINAGIYDRELRPLGLAIGSARTLRPLNVARSGGSGNFGLRPNGVFYVDRDGHAGVVPTEAWRAAPKDARVATQSGPMLVVDGAINQGFDASSDSRKWRSGVCAPTPGEAVFVVSERAVTFHAFARVFKESLNCRDALYLDGTLSQLYTAEGGYAGAPAVMVRPYAAMLAVFGEPTK